jgi:hypothetical protein
MLRRAYCRRRDKVCTSSRGGRGDDLPVELRGKDEGEPLPSGSGGSFLYPFPIFSTISSWVGKRPSSYFEKIFFPSTTTSKMPLEPLISAGSIPNVSLIAAARPAARGR